MEPSWVLPANAVHVWYTRPTSEPEHGLAERYFPLLAPEERRRHDRFVQEKDRRQYLLGKVLVRTLLSRYFGRTPADWTFAANCHGKPELAGGPSESVLHFNLAHTEGLVACVLSRDFEVGIDVENVGRAVTLDIARRFFAPAEVAYLEQQPQDQSQRAFFLFWTLKEAYVKARGLGLSLPLEQFAFRLTNSRAPEVVFDPAMNEDPTQWQFLLPEIPIATHQMAVAVRCPRKVDLEVMIQSMEC